MVSLFNYKKIYLDINLSRWNYLHYNLHYNLQITKLQVQALLVKFICWIKAFFTSFEFVIWKSV